MRSMPDVIVLCGGQGLRLRSVTGPKPKALASVDGRPFLELLLTQIARSGFRHVILAVGYQQEAIRSALGHCFEGVELIYSAEHRPLGTGGAVRKAASLVGSDAVLIMNGDSYTDVDLVKVVEDYGANAPDLSIVVVPVDGREDCGTVVLDSQERVVRFEEKTSVTGARYINAGIYILSPRLLRQIPTEAQLSLEKEVIPEWLNAAVSVRAFVHGGTCVDIGTPERYDRAQYVLRDAACESNSVAAVPCTRL